ncbi:MAG: DUF3782 domain-containing protein [bacterium]|nr:DUF3782 domain-containing protein [bacterium]
MTDEELKALVAKNSIAVAENSIAVAKNSTAVAENSRAIRELREESKQLREESNRQWERLWEEIRASRRDTDRLLGSFNRELGRLGNKLGDYTESLFRPSLERAMREQFKMTVVTSPLRILRHGEALEIDLVAHAVDDLDEVYLVEIKNQLREDGIDQLLDQLRQFPRFFPEHRGKKLFGVLAALNIPPNMRARALKEGFYLATIKDDVFEIVAPDDFVPHAFGLRGLS